MSSSSIAPTASPTRCSTTRASIRRASMPQRNDLGPHHRAAARRRPAVRRRGRARPVDRSRDQPQPSAPRAAAAALHEPARRSSPASAPTCRTAWARRRATPTTLVLAVKYLDGQLLSDISARFDLPNLRTIGHEEPNKGENLLGPVRRRRRADRAFRLDPEPARRQDRQHGAAVHGDRVRRLRAAHRLRAALHPPHRHEARRGREPAAPSRAARSALRPAEPHRVQRSPRRRDRDLGPRGDRRGGARDRPRPFQGHQRHARPSHRRRPDRRGGAAAHACAAPRRPRRAARRRRVRRHHHRGARRRLARAFRRARDRDPARALLDQRPHAGDRRQHRHRGDRERRRRRRRHHAPRRRRALSRQERRPQPRLHLRCRHGRRPARAQAAREGPARRDRRGRALASPISRS